MAVGYRALDQVHDDTRDDGDFTPPRSSPETASPSLSTESPTTFLSLTLGDQPFTPLSMDASDFDASDLDKSDASTSGFSPLRRGFGASWDDASPNPTQSNKAGQWPRRVKPAVGFALSHSGPSSTATSASRPAASGASIPNGDTPQPPQSLPGLQATSVAEREYDLTLAKNNAVGKNLIPPLSSSSTVPTALEFHDTSPSVPTSGVVVGHEPNLSLQDRQPREHSSFQSSSPNPDDIHANPPYPNPLTDAYKSTPPFAGVPNNTARAEPSRLLSQEPTPQLHVVANVTPIQPSKVRRVSNASVTIRHPAPDLNPRSGAYLGNIAALEATAERFSMTSSIEDAIRDAHDELKRSDSRRSSLLQANSNNSARTSSSARRRAGTDASAASLPPLSLPLSRQSSIVGTNNAARLGGYSPAGYVMSPATSLSNHSTRMRSGSKASSTVPPSAIMANMNSTAMSPDIGNSGEDFPFLSRHGPGKGSVRSVMSGKLSLAEIAEIEPPTSLTQDALDQADRAVVTGGNPDDDDTIRATAHQHIEAQFADAQNDLETPPAVDAFRPLLDHAYADGPAPRLQLHQPDHSTRYGHYNQDQEPERPATPESGATFEARLAFGDFDGVHCDPETVEFLESAAHPPYLAAEATPRARVEPPAARPTSYFDHSTGQQMLYYPARVPAMLNLPPKLSKKNGRMSTQNIRRSKVLSAMPDASRASRAWLPDPLEGLEDEQSQPISGSLIENRPHPDIVIEGPNEPGLPPQLPTLDLGEITQQQQALHSGQPLDIGTIIPAEQPERELRRPQRLTDTDKRQSHMTGLGDLPPQLRASAFFDLPSETPGNIEMKGGSAMATLDSILDASAAAPVSAFVDHVFAGKLGSEVYGTEKKPKKKKKKPVGVSAVQSQEEDAEPSPPLPPPGPRKLVKRNPSSEMLGASKNDPRKNASFLSLIGGGRPADDDDRRSAIGASNKPSPENEQEPFSPNQLAPGEDELEDDDESEEESDDEEGYQGAPTTLLAELQLRKQQQKMRTRPITKAYPNGLHTTLLELDAVHEVERRTRTKKRVNLAWEDPALNPAAAEDDDDDVPLAMLNTAKLTGQNGSTMDVSAFMAEVNRPLGLMERRDLEENEPLSRRRERLQGKEIGPVPVYLNDVQKRMSTLTLTPTVAALGATGNIHARSQSRLTYQMQPGDQDPDGDNTSEPDLEGETLAARKNRLAAENPLPRARPVSGLFSAELLGQFGEADEPPTPADPKSKGKSVDRGKENAPPGARVPDEEETLGQRRRRLQMEREAREREMGPGLGVTNGLHARNVSSAVDANRLSKRLSMADMLGAHPLEQAQGRMDPREQERLRREAEAMRVQREQDAKMAMLRSQMPNTLTAPSFGARTGGYMGGRFNDGLGGGAGAGAGANAGASLGYGNNLAWQQQPSQLQHQSTLGLGNPYAGGYRAPGGFTMQTNGSGLLANPGYGAYGRGMGVMPSPAQQAGHADMVERWRQSVMPSS